MIGHLFAYHVKKVPNVRLRISHSNVKSKNPNSDRIGLKVSIAFIAFFIYSFIWCILLAKFEKSQRQTNQKCKCRAHLMNSLMQTTIKSRQLVKQEKWYFVISSNIEELSNSRLQTSNLLFVFNFWCFKLLWFLRSCWWPCNNDSSSIWSEI